MITKITEVRNYPQLLGTLSAPAWRQFGTERFAGVIAPIPYIWTQQSVGHGEIPDEIELLKFCKLAGIKATMALPNNPIGYGASPYGAGDPQAFEPMIVAPTGIEDDGINVKDYSGKIKALRTRFPCGTGKINYAVRPEKLDLLWEMFKNLKGHESPQFRAFVREFKDKWLRDYLLYTVIKEQHNDEVKNWKKWLDPKLRDHDDAALSAFERANSERITFYAWIQWQASMQKRKVKAFADQIGRKIIGDLQIFPSSDSTGPWAHRSLFKMSVVAGAPRDPYADKGQRWDSHPYDREALQSGEGRRYIGNQQQWFGLHYHGRRYDHSIGGPRAWEIPFNANIEEQGLPGVYFPEPALRRQAGWDFFKLFIDSAPEVAPFFEDLGKLPTLEEDLFDWNQFCAELGALGMDVAFWKKNWDKGGTTFTHPNEYRELSMSTFGPHDMEIADAYYERVLGTVDRELFARACRETGVNYDAVVNLLFDTDKSFPTRLRWRDTIDDRDVTKRKLIQILDANRTGDRKLKIEEKKNFDYMRTSTYREQRALCNLMGAVGNVPETVTPDFVEGMLRFTADANSMANFELMPLHLKLDPTIYGSKRPRFNIPGTPDKNWEEGCPESMEELQQNEALIQKLRDIYTNSGRLTE